MGWQRREEYPPRVGGRCGRRRVLAGWSRRGRQSVDPAHHRQLLPGCCCEECKGWGRVLRPVPMEIGMSVAMVVGVGTHNPPRRRSAGFGLGYWGRERAALVGVAVVGHLEPQLRCWLEEKRHLRRLKGAQRGGLDPSRPAEGRRSGSTVSRRRRLLLLSWSMKN